MTMTYGLFRKSQQLMRAYDENCMYKEVAEKICKLNLGYYIPENIYIYFF